MKARLIVELTGLHGERQPVGMVIEHPEAYRYVRHGCGIPADEECEQAAAMTAEQMAAAQAAYPKVAAGLLREDYPAWDAGLMRGYRPDGSWIPGPNYDEVEEEEWEERKRESPIYIP